MKLLNLRITNFRSFLETQSFQFPEEPGLYFMQGVNEDEPRLEANGAGKSTVWEALLWCLYAKTSRGLKAGDVCNWSVPKGVRVELDFLFADNEDTVWTITRTWGPNSWTLSHESIQITDEEVVDLVKNPDNPIIADLRVEMLPFLHSVLMAQNQPMFLDLKSDRQAELFSEVMGLDHWLEASSNASKRASAQDIETRRLERKLAEIVGRIDGQQDFKGSVEDWNRKQKEKIKALEVPYLRLVKQHGDLEEQLKTTMVNNETIARKDFQILQESFTKAEKEFKLVEAASRELDRKVFQAESEYKRLAKELEEVEKDDCCPTCGRMFDEEDHRKHLYELKEQVSKAEKRFKGLSTDYKILTKEADSLGAKVMKIIQDRNDADDALADVEQAIKRARQQLNTWGKEMDALEDQEDRLRAEVNPFLDLQKKTKEEGARLRAERDSVQAQLDESLAQYRLFSFWVRGFKDLRLQLIAEALTELEIEVNSCVTALGLVNWELRFQVDRETKGGSISRGFSVEVLSPTTGKPTPWEAWSGGEGQRLRLATTMGLSNLIRSRMGVTLDLEVWDEPSTALSQQGVRDLLSALAHRAQVEQRQIWIVDHTSHSFGGFAGGATITKNKQGSSISQY